MRKYVLTVFGSLFAFNLHAAITGTVMTPAGQPIAGSTVSVQRLELDEARRERLISGAPENAPLASVKTAANGTFSLETSKESAVGYLQIEAAGFVPERRLIEMNDDCGAIVLQKAAPVKGRVTAAGKPLAGATVVATYGVFPYITKSDERGQYELPSAKNLVSIAVIHRDYGVDEDRTSEPRLERSLTASGIEGRVVTESGAPVAGATIYVDAWPLATSGEGGAFSITGAPAKWKVVSARKELLLGDRARVNEKSVTITLRKAVVVSGRLKDAKSGIPVAGAIVTIAGRDALSAGFREATQTDAKGRYSIAIPRGTYNAYIAHPAYMSDVKDVAAFGADITRDVSLTPHLRASGTVVDEARKPVAGATVRVETGEMAMLGGAARFASRETSAISGPDGKFAGKFDPRSEGETWLVAMKAGLPTGKSSPFKAAAGDRKSGVFITVPAGIAVSGKVTDQEGNPLAAVAVSVIESESGKRDPMTRIFAAGAAARNDDAVRTAADGTFTMRVSKGTYDFTFSREGFSPRTVRAQEIEPNLSATVDAMLVPSVAISGRVVREGTPIENVRIWSMGQQNNAVTAADGSFTLDGLTAGPVQVLFTKPDEFIDDRRSITAPARDVVVEFDGGGTIKGRVVEKETNKPVRDFSARIAVAGAGLRTSSAGSLKFTSDDGSFVLEHVPPGPVMVVVSAAGYAEARRNVDVENGKAISGIELQLDTGVKLTGRVTGPDGSPVSDVRVSIPPSASSGVSGSRYTTTDASGEYVLEGLAAAEERLVFSHAKHSNVVKMVALKGPETRLDVQLSAGRNVTGVVVTADGAPVSQADVTARSTSGLKAVRSDSSGAFEFDNLATGRYRFSATKEGFTTGSVDDVDTASTAPIRITLQPGARIYGRVTGLSDEELAAAEVTASGSGDRATAPIDASGNYRLDGSPVGTVRVSAEIRSQSLGTTKMSRPQTVEITPGSSRQVDLEFRDGIAIRGQVRRNGAPLQGGDISFVPRRGTDGGLTRGIIDEAGRYDVSNLSPGSYTVSVSDAQRHAPYTTDYEVRGSAVFDITYSTASIRGRVADAATGDALPNASVSLRSTSQWQSAFRVRTLVTDSVGSFVIDTVPPGSYNMTVTKDEFGTSVSDVQIADADVTGLEVKLSRADGVTLRVVDARDGRPLHPRVTVFDGQGRLVSDEIGLSQGGSNLGEVKLHLSPGSYSASITAEGYAVRNVVLQSPSSPTVALSTGGTIVVHSRHAERLLVRLIDPTGVPYFRWSGGAASLELLPSPASRVVPNVAGGTYTIQLLNPNETVVDTKQVTVQEGQTVTVEM